MKRRNSTLLEGISASWIIARLTLTEAVRRRFYFAGILVSVFYIALAFIPIHFSAQRRQMMGPLLDQFVEAFMTTYGAEMIEFFCFLFAVALSAGAISAELERGTLAVIVPKPLPRWSIYVGKWLGVNLFIVPLLIFWTCLLQWAVWMHVHVMVKSLWTAIPVMFLYPLLFSSVTLCFSSFAGNLLATIMPLILASTAWSEGILKLFGYGLDVNSLKVAARDIVYVCPLNPMSRWLERALHFEVIKQFHPGNRVGPIDPPANWIDLGWILGYAIGFFVLGMVVFQKRDL